MPLPVLTIGLKNLDQGLVCNTSTWKSHMYGQKKLEDSHKNLRNDNDWKGPPMHYISYCFCKERTSIIPFDVLNFITSPVGRAHRHTSLSCKPSLPETRIAHGTDHKKRMIFFIQILFFLFIYSVPYERDFCDSERAFMIEKRLVAHH